MTNWFNPYWWKYYWQADTVYQIHSPFLFDFATKLWPLITSSISRQPNSSSTEAAVRIWFDSFICYYRIEQVIYPANSEWANVLKSNSQISILNQPGLLPDNFELGKILKQDKLKDQDQKKPIFNKSGIFPISDLTTKNFKKMFSETDSWLVFCHGIHSSKANNLQWNEILGAAEFNFSVELYNFGLLFKHPVNQKPEHITLISWHKKPWKIKIL